MNLKDELKNPKFKLQEEDIVNILSINDLIEESYIEISGEVNNPGIFPYSKNLSLSDMILLAGGFNDNALIRIPFPKEAEKIKNSLNKIGFQKKVQEFENKMNETAENASKEALNILVNEVKNIKIKDAFLILNGKDNAATLYFKEKTSNSLYSKFEPIIVFLLVS